MPANTKLSRRAHDQLGEDVARELEDLFNRMDDSHKADLREERETNLVRFDAKLEQRLAEHGAGMRGEIAEMGASIRREMAEMAASIRGDIAQLRVEVMGEIARIGERIVASELRTSQAILTQTRWMVGLWAAQIAVLMGTVLVVLR